MHTWKAYAPWRYSSTHSSAWYEMVRVIIFKPHSFRSREKISRYVSTERNAMWVSELTQTFCRKEPHTTAAGNSIQGVLGGNVPDFGRMFLTLKYTDITQNTYIRSWTLTEIMAREVWKYDSCYTLTNYQIILKLPGICSFCNVNICTWHLSNIWVT